MISPMIDKDSEAYILFSARIKRLFAGLRTDQGIHPAFRAVVQPMPTLEVDSGVSLASFHRVPVALRDNVTFDRSPPRPRCSAPRLCAGCGPRCCEYLHGTGYGDKHHYDCRLGRDPLDQSHEHGCFDDRAERWHGAVLRCHVREDDRHLRCAIADWDRPDYINRRCLYRGAACTGNALTVRKVSGYAWRDDSAAALHFQRQPH